MSYINAPICASGRYRVSLSLSYHRWKSFRNAIADGSRILNLTMNANKHNPLRVGYQTPARSYTKRELINIQTTENACFAWSVVAALYPAQENAYRESLYPLVYYTSILNFAGIEFPMTLSQIKKFETLNFHQCLHQ